MHLRFRNHKAAAQSALLRGAHELFAFKAALQPRLCDVFGRKHIIVNAKRAFEHIARGVEDIVALGFALCAPRAFAVAAHAAESRYAVRLIVALVVSVLTMCKNACSCSKSALSLPLSSLAR